MRRAAPTDPRAIKHIHEISGWESGLRFRQTAGCSGRTLRAYFRRRRAHRRFPAVLRVFARESLDASPAIVISREFTARSL